MVLLFVNIALALLWSALTGQFTLENLTTGFLLGYIVLFLLRRVFPHGQYFSKTGQIVRFIAFFLWELLIANLRLARDVLRPGPLKMQPRVIGIPLEHHDNVPLLLLAVIVSLTPGTLLLDISDNRKTMFLHVIHAPDEEQIEREIKQGFERQVLRLFSKSTNPAADGKERKQ